MLKSENFSDVVKICSDEEKMIFFEMNQLIFPKPVLKIIFENSPIHVTLVCKSWYHFYHAIGMVRHNMWRKICSNKSALAKLSMSKLKMTDFMSVSKMIDVSKIKFKNNDLRYIYYAYECGVRDFRRLQASPYIDVVRCALKFSKWMVSEYFWDNLTAEKLNLIKGNSFPDHVDVEIYTAEVAKILFDIGVRTGVQFCTDDYDEFIGITRYFPNYEDGLTSSNLDIVKYAMKYTVDHDLCWGSPNLEVVKLVQPTDPSDFLDGLSKTRNPKIIKYAAEKIIEIDPIYKINLYVEYEFKESPECMHILMSYGLIDMSQISDCVLDDESYIYARRLYGNPEYPVTSKTENYVLPGDKLYSHDLEIAKKGLPFVGIFTFMNFDWIHPEIVEALAMRGCQLNDVRVTTYKMMEYYVKKTKTYPRSTPMRKIQHPEILAFLN